MHAQAQGKTMESYVAEHQDRSRNALLKSLDAAFKSWCEDLRADESQFLAEKILYLDWDYGHTVGSVLHFYWGIRISIVNGQGSLF